MSRARFGPWARYGLFCSVGLLFLTGFVAGAGSDSPTPGITGPGAAVVGFEGGVAGADMILPEAQPPGNAPEFPRDGDPPGKDPYGSICCTDVAGCYVYQGSSCPFGMTEIDCPCPWS